MSSISRSSFKPPIKDMLADDEGLLSRAWQTFFRKISDLLDYLGQESSFNLANNQAVAAAITGLIFDFGYTSQVIIDYVIQRTTSTTELIESGTLHLIYRPKTLTWSIYSASTLGDASGVTFSITSTGQVKYTSSNIGGTQVLSRIVFRKRELAAKSSLYSKVG